MTCERRLTDVDAVNADPDVKNITASYIVFFDGVCVLCHTGMRQLMALDTDGRLHYAQLQGETAKAFGIDWDDDAPGPSGPSRRRSDKSRKQRGPAHNRPSNAGPKPGSQTFVFVDNSGDEPIVYERMRAVRAELEVIDRLPIATFLLKVIPLPISNLLYKLIAATRYRLWGTYDACPLPPERARSRFLP